MLVKGPHVLFGSYASSREDLLPVKRESARVEKGLARVPLTEYVCQRSLCNVKQNHSVH